MAAQLSWNLDHTSTSAVHVAKGLLHAATTDNVQPLAIMACEQFGNTVAMSPDTVRKIEHSVVPTPQPAILTFLKSTIGYSANDCTSYLGKSLAGLQFLGLAAALVTCGDMFKAADTIQSMLISTARDKTLVPTVRQVQQLLLSIEPRCHRSGFADDVAGWQLLLTRHRVWTYFHGPPTMNSGIHAPGKQGLGNLVDALRQLNRVGAADIARVTVQTASCAAWTIAFVKWSLGCPPSVIIGNTSASVIEQPESRVTVIIATDNQEDQDFSITIYSSIHGPSNLVVATQREVVTGMVSLQTYGQLLLLRYNLCSGLARNAFEEVIPYFLHKAMEQLSKSPMYTHKDLPIEYMRSNTKGISRWEKDHGKKASFTDLRDAMRLYPFRGKTAISKMYELLFDEKLNPTFTQHEVDISDLPHMALLRRGCQCNLCSPNNESNLYQSCGLAGFYISLSKVVIDVLALSLVDCPDLLWVSRGAISENEYTGGLLHEVIKILKDGEGTSVGLSEILDRTLRILGHEVAPMREHHNWIISSAKGQSVWPTIYESQSYSKREYLSLSWHPGLLSHNGEVYDLAKCLWASRTGTDPITKICKEQVQKPCNLLPQLGLDWMVSAGEHSLHVALGVRSGPNQHHSVGFKPCTALNTLAEALLVEQCQHDSNAELKSSDVLLRFTGPIRPHDPDAEVSVVAVDCDDGLRLVALCNIDVNHRVVLRKGACLACCLEICQKTGSKVLIL